MLLIKLSLRNLMKHKGKSILAGLIIFIGSFLLTLGDASITGMESGIRESLVNRFLSDITVMSVKQAAPSAVFQPGGKPLPVLEGTRKWLPELSSFPNVDSWLPYSVGYLTILSENESILGAPSGCFVIGTDLAKYRRQFDNFEVTEGAVPDGGGEGMLMTEFTRNSLRELSQDYYRPGATAQGAAGEGKRDIVLMGAAETMYSKDVKVPVRGVIRYKALDSFWKGMNLLDAASFSAIMNYRSASGPPVLSVSEKAMMALGEGEVDALFQDGEAALEHGPETAGTKAIAPIPSASASSVDTASARPVAIADAPFQLISVRLKDGQALDQSIASLNAFFRDKGVQAKAVSWKAVSGQIASFVSYVRIFLSMVVAAIFFVAALVIASVSGLALLERSAEIGTMRAMGAGKGFIRRMLLGEALTLALVAGGAGILAAALCSRLLQSLRLSSSEGFLQLMFGGNSYQPHVSGGTVVTCLVMLGLVAALSSLYPYRLAGKIGPLAAMGKE